MHGNTGDKSSDNTGNVSREFEIDVVAVNGSAGSSVQQTLPGIELQVERPAIHCTAQASGDVAVLVGQHQIFADNLATQSSLERILREFAAYVLAEDFSAETASNLIA